MLTINRAAEYTHKGTRNKTVNVSLQNLNTHNGRQLCMNWG